MMRLHAWFVMVKLLQPHRKICIVLFAGESFLLSRRNDVAILDEGSRTVMVEGGDAEQSHGTSSRSLFKTPCR
jgi:hypothetical protein